MAISGIAGSQTSSSPGATASQPMINQQQFLQLLTAQLKAQDPMNPVSATDFTSQLAQLSSLSGIEQLNTSIQQMLQLQQLSQGAALMGKTVTFAQSGTSQAGKGIVQGVAVQNGQLQIQVGKQQVPIAQINGIVQAAS
jgi:flagellar basal-body rod modification protein FlgD